jgi:tRNA (cmo5U34)-methyltransferase
MPDKPWAFDRQVADCFDDMLERSIPGLDTMRSLVTRIALRYAQPETEIIDLGCSRGSAMEPLVKALPNQRFIGVEVSEPMREYAEMKFHREIEQDRVRILNVDLRHEYPPNCKASVTLAILTLQFTPLEYRHHIMRRIYDHTVAGGVVILVEKVMGSTAEWDQLLTEEYLAFKGQSHYTQEQIARKRLALEGVLVPLTAEWNESLIQNAGFAKPECFWRNLNFAGWVARKKADV